MDDLIEEQIRYYRQRAAEYDATTRPEDDPFAAISAEARDALRRLAPVEHAIELGAGTGAFTAVVAEIARRVTCVDAAPEMLELNRAKVPAADVERVVADVFVWRPTAPAALVVFTFLLSHVPAERFVAFWDGVRTMLAPRGRVFLMDETRHGLWREERAPESGSETAYRQLADGRRFRIVKVLWDPDELSERLAQLGWEARLVRRDPFFWGTARPTSRRPPRRARRGATIASRRNAAPACRDAGMR